MNAGQGAPSPSPDVRRGSGGSGRQRGASGPPRTPAGPVLSTLRPLPARHSHLLPAALLVSAILHLLAIAGFVMHPASRQRPMFKEPMMVKLIELPSGRGGATTGTPGRTREVTPPKVAEPARAEKPPKLTLPGKVPPKPKEGPSPLASTKPGQTAGLGHGGQAGLGGTSSKMILDEPTFQYEWYKARLEDALKSNWNKPVLSGTKSITASVHFNITASGQAQDVQIVTSSGNSTFDQTVLHAVYSSVPFPKFPPQYDAPTLGVLYTFELSPEGTPDNTPSSPQKPGKEKHRR